MSSYIRYMCIYAMKMISPLLYLRCLRTGRTVRSLQLWLWEGSYLVDWEWSNCNGVICFYRCYVVCFSNVWLVDTWYRVYKKIPEDDFSVCVHVHVFLFCVCECILHVSLFALKSLFLDVIWFLLFINPIVVKWLLQEFMNDKLLLLY